MKKLLCLLCMTVILLTLCSVSAAATVTNDVVKVGLRYGGSAMPSANLENTQSGGFCVGYYDSGRNFVSLGRVGQNAVTLVPADTPFSQTGPYGSFDEAAAHGEWAAYAGGQFYARNRGGGEGRSSSAVAVTDTGSGAILFEFDDSSGFPLALEPDGGGPTWFKGTRYPGGFEYPSGGGGLSVINVVNLEDYVKGVLPSEMSSGWPMEALKAQAVCARTFAIRTAKHASSGFDVCAATDCQMYSGRSAAEADTDAAVDATAGQCAYYNGEPAETVYHSSDGGATESAENVWGGEVDCLLGKPDPYEAMISIPNYSYTVTYTPEELTWILQNSGRSIGTVENVYVAERTPVGNVSKVVFVDTTGKELTVTGDDCRMAFYSTTYGKIVKSLRFSINGDTAGMGGSPVYHVNDAGTALPSLEGASAISGSGAVTAVSDPPHILTSSGTAAAAPASGGPGAPPAASGGAFVITGTGNGHNVGMSQYGARAMAEQGMSYLDILNFYYTNITIG